ncbi:MAG: von Willebrand factor type A domain-containing protein, partial [Myxococcota bacterium]|nr:von Willebrand factor type A domain-containing protein [Myxococcota bacterium]
MNRYMGAFGLVMALSLGGCSDLADHKANAPTPMPPSDQYEGSAHVGSDKKVEAEAAMDDEDSALGDLVPAPPMRPGKMAKRAPVRKMNLGGKSKRMKRGRTKLHSLGSGQGGGGIFGALSAEPNTERYHSVESNSWKRVADAPLSTFSIDVDTASYANVRRMIREGRLPVHGAVRIEEMLNYFNYDYPAPTGDVPFAVHTEVAPAPWNDAHHLVRVGVKGKDVPRGERPASNLVFLLDVSGSMSMRDKLPLLKAAFKVLVNQLDERDSVAIV